MPSTLRRRSSFVTGAHNVIWCADYYSREDATGDAREYMARHPDYRYRIRQLATGAYELTVWNSAR